MPTVQRNFPDYRWALTKKEFEPIQDLIGHVRDRQVEDENVENDDQKCDIRLSNNTLEQDWTPYLSSAQLVQFRVAHKLGHGKTAEREKGVAVLKSLGMIVWKQISSSKEAFGIYTTSKGIDIEDYFKSGVSAILVIFNL